MSQLVIPAINLKDVKSRSDSAEENVVQINFNTTNLDIGNLPKITRIWTPPIPLGPVRQTSI